MRRSGVIRHRSRKTERAMRDRRVFVALMLEEHPICQRCSSARSVDVHELVRRSQGGSTLDPANCRALCRLCHAWIGAYPVAAEAEGWAVTAKRSGMRDQ